MKKTIISEKTALLLLLLSEKPMTSVELADRMNMFPSKITPYLYYLRKQGLISQNSLVYSLTQAGRSFVERNKDYFIFILNSKNGIKINKDELKSIKIHKHLSKFEILEKIKEQAFDIPEECWDIVMFLIEHRLKTGDLYWYSPSETLAYGLSEEIGSSSGSIQGCLKRLLSNSIVYFIYDSRMKMPKIRIHRRFDYLFSRNKP